MADIRENLAHVALLYRGREEFAAQVVKFARAGMAGGEPVLLALPGGGAQYFSEPINGNSADLTSLDMLDIGRNPARIIPEIMAFKDKHSGSRFRYIGEAIWPGRSRAEITEALRYETLLNQVFAGTPITIMCPYDAAGLEPDVIASAERAHTEIIADGQVRPSAPDAGLGGAPDASQAPLSRPPAGTATLVYGAGLAPVRDLVRDFAERAGLSEDRVTDLVIAVSELAANTLAHTAGTGLLRIWSSESEVLCQVQDAGWITDPLAGYLRHDPGSRGHGLWLVNQVCDLVERRTGPGGTVIRVHMRLR